MASTSPRPSEKSVLFVCLGNICRSPMAEAILKYLVEEREDAGDWLIESSATSRYHIGGQPDDRCIATLEKNNIKNFRSTVRQINKADYSKFSWIFVFDSDNKKNVEREKPSSSNSNVVLLRKYDNEEAKNEKNPPAVIDPYYHDDSFFDICYDQCNRSLKYFLKSEFDC